MKKSAMLAEEIKFLDFTFNPQLRTLQNKDNLLQLRKKQSDVLALLCAKYPEPVGRDEFLKEVWDTGYVTSQSIAQIIRSLRVSMGDEAKSIIVTIPKLGYKLSVQPYSKKNEVVTATRSFDTLTPGNVTLEHVSFTAQSVMQNMPFSKEEMSSLSCIIPKMGTNRKKLTPQTLFIGVVAVLCLSLICGAIPV